jgi:hypothetical protein
LADVEERFVETKNTTAATTAMASGTSTTTATMISSAKPGIPKAPNIQWPRLLAVIDQSHYTVVQESADDPTERSVASSLRKGRPARHATEVRQTEESVGHRSQEPKYCQNSPATAHTDHSAGEFLSPLTIEDVADPIGFCPSLSGKRCSDKGFLSLPLVDYLE